MTNLRRAYDECGQSIWHDGLRRGLLRSGELARLVRDGLRGVLADCESLEQALAGSTDYDDALRRLVVESRSVRDIFQELLVEDVREAADVLRPLYEESKERDGWVAVELLAQLAGDTALVVADALNLRRAVARDNVMVRVPATDAGLKAFGELVERGVPVVVTEIFDPECFRRVADVHTSALQQRAEATQPLEGMAAFAAIGVGLLDVAVDRRLREALQGFALLGKAGLAVAQSTYTRYFELYSSSRFDALRARGAQPLRLLFTHTMATDPRASDTRYVEELGAMDTACALSSVTLSAFEDHGEPRTSLVPGRSGEHVLGALRAAGVDVSALSAELTKQHTRARQLVVKRVLEVIDARREALLEQAPERQVYAFGESGGVVGESLRALGKQEAGRRLWSVDPSLYTSDPQHASSIKNRLGWLRGAELMRPHADELAELARRFYRAGLRKAVLLGMGGSSLCPEVLAKTWGKVPGFLELEVLDSTDPAAVLRVERALDYEKTLFVVASKSGTTIEVSSFEAYFWQQARARLGEAAAQHFVAITDPETALYERAASLGYARVFENPKDIGGRYSAISFFGMVPAALAGADVSALVHDAARMAVGCAPFVAAEDNPGLRLGAFLGGLARAGRDKLTLIASPEIESFGSWIEQLVAESTGKLGSGIVPVDLEPVAEPRAYGSDRAFVYLRFGGRQPTELDARVEQLIAAGHPVVRLGLLAKHDLGGEFFRWEVATAIAASVLGVNPFDEPNVTEAKQQTQTLIDAFLRDGSLPAEPAVTPDASQLLATLRGAKGGDYVVFSAYFDRSPQRDAAFTRVRARVRDKLGAATTLGYGPRFLHSTGQLHKGGPNTGVFVVLTADATEDVSIPGQKYSFGVLRDAQALGDVQVLARRGRRLVRVRLGKNVDAGLEALEDNIARL